MDKELRILFIEDDPDDHEIIKKTLRLGGVTFTGTRVENGPAFRKELLSGAYDLVMSDYSLPLLTGLEALKIKMEIDREIPFILVTGTQSEDVAVNCMREGADDYLLKSSMLRLPLAVEHAVLAAEARRERKRAEEMLIASEQKYRAIIEHNSDVVILAAPDGTLLYHSPAVKTMLGYEFEENLRKNMYDFVSPDDANKARSIMASLLSEPQRIVRDEIRARHKDGSLLWVEFMARNLLNVKGVGAMVVSYHDITMRKRSEEALRLAKERAEEYDRLKSNFISSLSLELRTPLETLLGSTRRVRTTTHESHDTALAGKLEEHFDIIDRSGQRLKDLVDSFFDVANIQSGSIRLALASHNVVSLVKKSAAEYHPKFAKANLVLREEWESETVVARLDSDRVLQIIGNILSNVVKFTSRGGASIRTKEDGGFVAITIEDSGPGIPADFMPQLFATFRQASEGPGRGIRGSGLGLVIARRLTEAMAGTLEVASVEGTGTTVTIRFPLAIQESTATPLMQETRLGSPSTSEVGMARRALVVEGNTESMLLTKAVLRAQGWTVSTARSGDEATQTAVLELPTLIVLDLQSEDAQTEFALLRSIRQAMGRNTVPALAIATRGTKLTRTEILAGGFNGVLQKPITPDALMRAAVDLQSSAPVGVAT